MSSPDGTRPLTRRSAALAGTAVAAAALALVGSIVPAATAATKTPGKAVTKAGTKAGTKVGTKVGGNSEAVTGTITVNGTITKMRYGHARQVKGFFDSSKNDTEVVLSDVALSATALADGFELDRLAKAGKAHTFEITIDAKGSPVSMSFHAMGFAGPAPSGPERRRFV